MAESTLSLGRDDLRTEVAYFLGYGRTAGNWVSDETTNINQALDMGLRQFYFPPPDGTGRSHRWSFLSPTTTLATVASDYDYNLPDDFGFMTKEFSFAPDAGYEAIKTVGEQRIRTLRQMGSVTGRPRFVAIVSRSLDHTVGQRFQAWFWPTPDAAYTLTYSYEVLQDALTAANPYPLGGAAHAETIKASCIAAAEELVEDRRGERWNIFMQRLAASIEVDRRMEPMLHGYNLDRSDDLSESSSRLKRSITITVNGVTPS